GLLPDDEIGALVRAIDDQMILHLRARHARGVSLDGIPVCDLADTTAATRALLDEIGPTVRMIRERSKVPGELSLKRDVTDKIREEVSIARAGWTARSAGLPPPYKQLRDAAGFGRGVDSVVNDEPPQRSSQPAFAVPMARASQPAIAPPARPSQPMAVPP